MGKIVALLGKSASGKDTILNRLLGEVGFLRVLPVTTRPRRPGEEDGVNYKFMSPGRFAQAKANGEFIETREYHTLYNGIPDIWYYATARAGIDLSSGNYVAIVDLDALDALRAEYKEDLFAVYLDVPEEVRRRRCVGRGDFSVEEWERREADDNNKYTAHVLDEKIDLILDNTSGEVAFDKLITFLKSKSCI